MKKLKQRATGSGPVSSEWQSWDTGTDPCSLKAKVLSNSQLAVIMHIVLATGGRYLMKTFILKFCILTVSIIHSFPQLLKGGLVVISGGLR